MDDINAASVGGLLQDLSDGRFVHTTMIHPRCRMVMHGSDIVLIPSLRGDKAQCARCLWMVRDAVDGVGGIRLLCYEDRMVGRLWSEEDYESL